MQVRAHLQDQTKNIFFENLLPQNHKPDNVLNTKYVSTYINLRVYASDCSQVFSAGHKSSGLYRIKANDSPSPVQVYCDMSEGGGWTIIQRRLSGARTFNRCVLHLTARVKKCNYLHFKTFLFAYKVMGRVQEWFWGHGCRILARK